MNRPEDVGQGVLHIDNDKYDWYATPYMTAILPQEDGDTWFATKEGLFTFSNGIWGQIPTNESETSTHLTTAVTGPDGAAWLGTTTGFARFDGQVWTKYEMADGSELEILALTFDDQGLLWLSTREGIGRFDGQKLLLYAYGADNPFNDIVSGYQIGVSMRGFADSLAVWPDGALWMPFGHLGIMRFIPPDS